MSSWWRRLVENRSGGAGQVGPGTGSWKRRAAEFYAATANPGGSWSRRLAGEVTGALGAVGGWTRRIVLPDSPIFGSAGRMLVMHGARDPLGENQGPTDIVLSAAAAAEDAALGTVVGVLSATDPDAGDMVTFSLTNDASGLFGVSGNNLIVTGVLDYETATSHNVTVRATDSFGATYEEILTIIVTDVSETPPADPPPADGTVVDDGTFTDPPIFTVVDGGAKLHGKKAASSLGKFIYDLGAAVANTTYVVKYDPDFTLLTNTGKNAAVGLVLKQGNDFHFVGLRGDGSTGLNAVEVYGANKWTSGTGFTEVDGGAALHGTQTGPNWVQFQVSANGATYIFRTSADGVSWSDEFTAVAPSPHSTVTGPAQFGIGAIFESTDTGSFSIKIEAWVATTFWTPDLFGSSVLIGWYDAADAASITQASNAVSQWNDKSGNANHMTEATAGRKPTTNTQTQNSLNVIDFDGGDVLTRGAAPTNWPTHVTFVAVCKFDSATNGYVWDAYNASGHSAFQGRTAGGLQVVGRGISSGAWANLADTDVTNWKIVSGYVNHTVRELWTNGTLDDTTGTDVAALTPSDFYIGSNDSVAGLLPLDGKIAELAFLAGPSNDKKRQLLEGYCAHKWNLAANLPGGHPYKSAPPSSTESPESGTNTIFGEHVSTPEVVMSGAGLVATHTGVASDFARSTHWKNSGKYYFEITIGTPVRNLDRYGILTKEATEGNFLSNNTNSAFTFKQTGGIWANNADTGDTLGALAVGDVIGVAVDLNADIIWFRKSPSGNWNGQAGDNPATGTGGNSISNYSGTSVSPSVGFTATGANGAENVTANFGDSAFVGSVPSGFISGWPV